MLKGKHIVLGITGSIAAYKAAYLLRLLVKKGAEVQVVMTPAAKEFITPVTLSPLSGKPVVSEFFAANDGQWHSHVDLGLWADAMLIAPATAASIGKMAHGVADNMLITTYLSMKAPVFVSPAMDLDMYKHPSTQANLKLLQSYGNHIIEPGFGELASGLEGKGRMEEPEAIVAYLENYFAKSADMKGEKVLITAGPTYEKIDPVRFIGNYSSGKMAYALAEVCAQRGAEVYLVSGPVALETPAGNIHRIDMESAEEMYQACIEHFPSCQTAILCAAVADYRVAEISDNKIKREESGELCLHLLPNKDIAAALGERKQPSQYLLGFALETHNESQHAEAKLRRKNLDAIVLNSLQDQGAGFRHDTNKVSILSAEERLDFPLKTKKEVASDIIDYILKNRKNK
ncbi:MAG: bifunctional phosphopantothenoylcysteine decarboxylase/phosphopantothenate--cysteine ligase CoaBC [Bacteroidales bacterium]|nr:bifunctional phosphopantothenoylcysteine decarboxylase/phosphopantothenate--cysteine ligase CoaBC [Bacteroidales bacterium]